MPTCVKCGRRVEVVAAFQHDDAFACRIHLLDLRSAGTVEVVRGGRREFIYSATNAELHALTLDPAVTEIVIRSLEWASTPRTYSRPLKVSNAYNRQVHWMTLKN